jgi:hypothetical protein
MLGGQKKRMDFTVTSTMQMLFPGDCELTGLPSGQWNVFDGWSLKMDLSGGKC